MNEIKKRKEGLYCYKAMIGTGKTTFIMALCEYVKSIREYTKS